MPGLRNRAALTTAYGAGLRVCEVAALKVGDIDSSRMVIRVEHGKGGKDRYVMLSPQLLRILRAYWRLAKPAAWLFPGRQGDRPVSTATLQAACRVAARKAELGKPVTVHTLRHSFATHLLRAEHRHSRASGLARSRDILPANTRLRGGFTIRSIPGAARPCSLSGNMPTVVLSWSLFRSPTGRSPAYLHG